MTTQTVEEPETREDIEEALGHLTRTAKRCFPVTGTEKYPTPWDKAHAHINDMLDRRDKAVA